MSPHQPRRTGLPDDPDPLPLPVVDNHVHLDIVRRDEDGAPLESLELAEAISRARRVGVDRLVQVGCDLESARWTVEILPEHPQLLGAVALHPNEAPRHAADGTLDAAYAEIERLAAHPRVRAIGETGLDYYRTAPDGVAAQQESFRRHIDMAKRLGLVLQIHDRDAHDDVLRILDEEGAPERTVLHCFSGDQAFARACVERGYVLSFSGTITFKSSNELRNALAITPLEQVLVETDAPYLTPHPHRGATNASYLVPLTVRMMARHLMIDVPTLCAAVSENSERLYGPWHD